MKQRFIAVHNFVIQFLKSPLFFSSTFLYIGNMLYTEQTPPPQCREILQYA
jgi:hypothetical protein